MFDQTYSISNFCVLVRVGTGLWVLDLPQVEAFTMLEDLP